MRHPVFFSLLMGVSLCAQPQTPDADQAWLDGSAARSFRDRVVELALIYGDSSGIDPRGYIVVAKRAAELVQACADVDVYISSPVREVRRERLHACRHLPGTNAEQLP